MAIRDIVTMGYGNGTFSPGVSAIPTLGYGIGVPDVVELGNLVCGRVSVQPVLSGTVSISPVLGGTVEINCCECVTAGAAAAIDGSLTTEDDETLITEDSETLVIE